MDEELLIISHIGENFPNSWTIDKRLHNLYDRLHKRKSNPFRNLSVSISILTDIMVKNPRTYPIWMAVFSKIASFIESEDEKSLLISKLRKKLEKIPNTGYLNIWLQRATIKMNRDIEYWETLCKKVNDTSIELWDCSWMKGKLKKTILTTSVISEDKITGLDAVINTAEVNDFFSY